MTEQSESPGEAALPESTAADPVPAEIVSTPRPRWRVILTSIIGPILLFGVFYVGSTLAFGLAVYPLVGAGNDLRATTAYSNVSLLAALVASFACIRICDRGRWKLGLAGTARSIGWQSLAGLGVATAVIGLADLLIVLTTNFRHVKGPGFDWWHVLVLFLPAAAHEELVFRGYPFQKLLTWNKTGAVLISSLIFMAVHLGNPGVEFIGMADVFVAGVLLALAYLVWNSLWFPIALHFCWNVLSGPVLGHEVSGLKFNTTVLRTIDPGPAILTGGPFGIEASIFTLVLDIVAALILMAVVIRRRNRIPLIGVSMETAVTSSAAAGIEDLERQ
ncbi:MAG: type II CAAX endopeptidase family protein [Acidobacteriota bacterium]